MWEMRNGCPDFLAEWSASRKCETWSYLSFLRGFLHHLDFKVESIVVVFHGVIKSDSTSSYDILRSSRSVHAPAFLNISFRLG